jgi:chorismate mutase/prephenate dehydrogenase
MLRRTLLAVPALAAAQSSNVDSELASFRSQIDEIDDQIVDLLSRRGAIVRKVGEVKKRAGLPVAAPGREKQVLDRVAARAQRGPLPAELVQRIYKQIITEMSAWEAPK